LSVLSMTDYVNGDSYQDGLICDCLNR
jgi:hypothetical protein